MFGSPESSVRCACRVPESRLQTEAGASLQRAARDSRPSENRRTCNEQSSPDRTPPCVGLKPRHRLPPEGGTQTEQVFLTFYNGLPLWAHNNSLLFQPIDACGRRLRGTFSAVRNTAGDTQIGLLRRKRQAGMLSIMPDSVLMCSASFRVTTLTSGEHHKP